MLWILAKTPQTKPCQDFTS